MPLFVYDTASGLQYIVNNNNYKGLHFDATLTNIRILTEYQWMLRNNFIILG